MKKRCLSVPQAISKTILIVVTSAIVATAATIEIGNQVDPKDLDPQKISGIQEEHIINQLFEGLYMQDPKNLKVIPGVAESHTLSKDGKTYTFKLRKDAKWSNGEPLTAEDFVYSFKRLGDPKTTSEYIHHAWLIKNGKADFTNMAVTAKDPQTLVVELEYPVPYFLHLLEHFSFMPVHKASIEKHGDKWTRAGNLVSNGPYALTRWDTNKILSVKKNEHYWDKKKVTIEQANIYPIENMDTEEQMFLTKKLHVTSAVPIEKVEKWRGDKTGVYQNVPYFAVYLYRLNTKKPPLDDVRVRRALAMSIDRDQIVRLVLKGGQLPATCYTAPKAGEFYDCKNLFPEKASIKHAQKLLSDAGYPGGKGFPSTVEVIYNTADIHKKVAEAIQQMWKKNLNIDVKITNMEWKVLLSNVDAGNYSIARGSWTGDFLDPVTFLNLWRTDNGKNNTGFSDPKYDGLLDQAAKEPNLKKRAKLLMDAEKLAAEGVPAIPIYVFARQYLIAPEVSGWYPNILGKWYLKYVSLEQKKKTGT